MLGRHYAINFSKYGNLNLFLAFLRQAMTTQYSALITHSGHPPKDAGYVCNWNDLTIGELLTYQVRCMCERAALLVLLFFPKYQHHIRY